MTDSFEFKPDYDKYKGMTTEEANRAMDEDERKAIESDPRTVAAVRNMVRYEASRRAEQQRKADEQERERQAAAAAAAAELEEEKQRRRRIWLAGGGTESEFAEAWPGMRQKIIVERVDADDASAKRSPFGCSVVAGVRLP